MTNLPVIIVTVPDDANEFEWLSDGWHTEKNRHTAKAKSLYAKAVECIEAGENVPDVIERLQKAGFTVTRT